jgi:pseudouridylate synthase
MRWEQFPFTIRLRRISGYFNPMTPSLALPHFVSSQIDSALRTSLPLVALESTVITHGLPRPQNLELARDMEYVVRENGAVPATIAVLDGKIHIGLIDTELERLANTDNLRKISLRDFAAAIIKKECGGTTIAGTMFAAYQAGIKVLATGGIGGVHDLGTFDISTDLQALANTPMLIVCAGAKAILDLPSTLEYLETVGVPVIGYRTGEFPAFYSIQSGLPVSLRLDSPQDVVAFARIHWDLGMPSAVLVCQPIPLEEEIPQNKMAGFILHARELASAQGLHGQQLTPFLLSKLSELTGGESLNANLALLKNNAKLAALIARSWFDNRPSI